MRERGWSEESMGGKGGLWLKNIASRIREKKEGDGEKKEDNTADTAL